MKKRLILLPVLGGFLLSGCSIFGIELPFGKKESEPENKTPEVVPSGDQGGSEDTPQSYNFPAKSSDVFAVIDYDDISANAGISGKATYPSDAFSFVTDGIKFDASNGVGIKSKPKTGKHFYYDSHILQFSSMTGTSRDGGIIKTPEAVEASKISVLWVATYKTEDKQYHPVVKVGDSADSISTQVWCNEGTGTNKTVSGKATGCQEYIGNPEQDRDVYFYQTTYDVGEHSYFSISASNGATYIHSIWIHH